MNKTIKKLWVKELRGGDFSQGKNRLRDSEDNLCCLGVLCELAYEADVIPAPVLSKTNECYMYAERRYGGLPTVVREWAGLGSNPGAEGTLVLLNDSYLKSFNEIADYIEAKL